MPQLETLGITPADVRWVVLTHLHIDHDGGIRGFPNAEFVVASGEYAQAAGFAGRLRGYVPRRWPKGWRPRLIDFTSEPFGTFERSFRLTQAGDVVLVPTLGHTAHHLSVIVQTGGLHYFLAGDTSYTEALLLAGAVDGVSPDRRTVQETLARIRGFAERHPTVYLPTHDSGAAERLRFRQVVARSRYQPVRDAFSISLGG